MTSLRFIVSSPSRLHRLLLTWCACFLLAPALAVAQDLPIVSDGKNVWVVSTDPANGVVILHRQTDDEPNRLQVASELSGAADEMGIAASDDRLYIVFSDHTVHSYSVNSDTLTYLRYDSPSRIEPSLPPNVKILSMVAGPDSLYVLVGSDKPEVLASIDAMVPVTSHPTGLLPDESDAFPVQTQPLLEQPATTPATQTDTAPATTAPISFAPGCIRLLKLQRGDWVNVPLPSQITDQFPLISTLTRFDRAPIAYLVRPHSGQKDPTLLIWTPDQADTIASLWSLDETGWKSQSRKLTGIFSARPVVVEGQIIVSRTDVPMTAVGTAPATLPTKSNLYMYVLRSDGVFPVGKIAIGDPSPGGWALIPIESNLAVVEKEPKDTLSWTIVSISPSGTRPSDAGPEIGGANIVSPSAPLVLKPYNPLTDGASLLLQVGTFLFSIAVAAIIWRRNPSASPPMLPADLVPADSFRRALAFAIDIGPCLFLISQISHIDSSDLIGNLFRQHATWEMIRPAAAVVLVYVGHTCLSELFTGRSMGKAMTGLRVANYLGQPAGPGQILIRNLLKAFEIVGWPLMFLPITLQFGQRLGDLAARTVVVTNKPEDEDEEDDEFDDM